MEKIDIKKIAGILFISYFFVMCSKEDDLGPPPPPPSPSPEILSFTTFSIHSNKSITDVFKTNAIVNQEMNCFVDGTALTVSSIDAGNNTITLNWLPNLSSVTSPAAGKEWIVGMGLGNEPSLSGQDQAYLKIISGNYATKTLIYNPDVVRNLSAFAVGVRVYLYNIHGNGWNFNMGQSLALISSGVGYYSNMLGPGGVWKHSDGTYRMAVNGYNGTSWQVGLFSSTDLVNWTSSSSTAKITCSAGTWRNTGIHLTSIHKLNGADNKFIGYGYGQDGSMMRIGWVKFDEDMNNISYSSTEILSTSGTYSGLYGPSVSHSDGEYKMLVAARVTSDVAVYGWEIWEAYSSTPDGIFTFRKAILNTIDPSIRDTRTCYRSSHTTETCQFYWNGKLCSIVDGTGRWNYSANRGERQFGVMYNNSGTWTDYTMGINMGSYQFASAIWDRPEGHVGGAPVIFYDNNKLYMYFALTQIMDAYQVVGSVYDLVNRGIFQ